MKTIETEDPKAVRIIAPAAGISSRDVIAAVLTKLRTGLLRSIHDAEGAANPMDRLDALVRGYIRMLGAHPGIPRLLRSSELHRSPLRLQAHIDYEGVLEWIRQQMVAAQRAECIRQDGDPRLLALLLPGMLEALITRWLLCDCAFSLEEAGEAAWQDFLALVGAHGSN